MATRPLVRGTVLTFDREVGLGTVRSSDGAELLFHATAIAGGSRDVEIGVAVLYEELWNHGGTVEAGSVTVVGPAPE